MKLRLFLLLLVMLTALSPAVAFRQEPPEGPQERKSGHPNPDFGAHGSALAPGLGNFQNSEIQAVVLDPATGHIYAGGAAWDPRPPNEKQFALWKFTPEGNLDESFGDHGVVLTDFPGSSLEFISAMEFDNSQEANPKIVVGGIAETNGASKPALARYDKNGRLDPTFGNAGLKIISLPRGISEAVVNDFKIDSIGNILLGGYALNLRLEPIIFLARLRPQGVIDLTFGFLGFRTYNIPNSANEAITALDTIADGTIYTGGYATAPNGSLKFAIGNFAANGRNGDVIIKNPDALEVAVIADLLVDHNGKILVGGSQNGKFIVARFLADAGADAGFGQNGIVEINFPAGMTGTLEAIRLTSENKIVAVGNVERRVNQQNIIRMALVQLEPNGALDAEFGEQGIAINENQNPAEQKITSLAVNPENQILAGGKISLGPESQGLVVKFLGTALAAPDQGAGVQGGGQAEQPAGEDAPAGGGAGDGGVGGGGGGGAADVL